MYPTCASVVIMPFSFRYLDSVRPLLTTEEYKETELVSNMWS